MVNSRLIHILQTKAKPLRKLEHQTQVKLPRQDQSRDTSSTRKEYNAIDPETHNQHQISSWETCIRHSQTHLPTRTSSSQHDPIQTPIQSR